MFKSKLLAMFLLLAGVFIINSCGDDDDNNPINPPAVGENFFTVTEGDKWTYDSYSYEASGDLKTTADNSYTVEVTGKETISGRETYIYTHTNDGVKTKKHFIPDGKILEGLSSEIVPSSLPFDLVIPDEWVTIADLTKNEWQVYSLDIVDFPFEYSGIKGTISGKLTIMGEVKEKQNIEVNGTEYETQRIEMKYQIKITSGTIGTSPVPTEMNLEIVSSFYYAEGKGLLKTVLEPQTLTLMVLPIPVEGYQDQCTQLDVK